MTFPPSSATGPLAGRTVVVTRPREQAAPLAERIRAAGGQALIYPLLEILPADPQAVRDRVPDLARAYCAFFVSPNAVQHSLPLILAQGPWPATLLPAAVGGGTAAALARFGLERVVAPRERFDSEGLLALPEFGPERVAGKEVLIFRGDGGRELVAQTLTERGARVSYVTCYHRRPPQDGAAPLLAAWGAGSLDALVLSSSEALTNLWSLLDPAGRARLAATPVFVVHPRIAQVARDLGLVRVEVTGPGDEGLFAGLCAYNW